MSKGDTVQAMKKPAPKAAQNCVHRPVVTLQKREHNVAMTTTITFFEKQ
jgi:hypothetical protein